MSTDNHDPLAFARNLWGSMGIPIPGIMAPTLDVEELEKRIVDMKTVEGWLKMNLTMLQTTIQGMEVQLATLGAVSTFRDTLAAAAKASPQAAAQPKKTAEPTAPPPAQETPTLDTQPIVNAFMQAAQMWPWPLPGTPANPESESAPPP